MVCGLRLSSPSAMIRTASRTLGGASSRTLISAAAPPNPCRRENCSGVKENLDNSAVELVNIFRPGLIIPDVLRFEGHNKRSVRVNISDQESPSSKKHNRGKS